MTTMWRVVEADGTAHEVPAVWVEGVAREHARLRALHYANARGIPAREVVAPGDLSADERVAAVLREIASDLTRRSQSCQRQASQMRGAVAEAIATAEGHAYEHAAQVVLRASAAETRAGAVAREVGAVEVERERCAALCDAAKARWHRVAPGQVAMDDVRMERGNEASALAEEIRATPKEGGGR